MKNIYINMSHTYYDKKLPINQRRVKYGKRRRKIRWRRLKLWRKSWTFKPPAIKPKQKQRSELSE